MLLKFYYSSRPSEMRLRGIFEDKKCIKIAKGKAIPSTEIYSIVNQQLPVLLQASSAFKEATVFIQKNSKLPSIAYVRRDV